MKNKYLLILIVFAVIILVNNFVFAGESSAFEQGSSGIWDDWDSNIIVSSLNMWLNPAMEYDTTQTLNWYPLAEWEYEVCSQTFTSDYFLNNQNGGHADIVDERIYDLAISVNAELKNTSFIDENDNKEYLLSMSWYIQGVNPLDNSNVKYKILLIPNRDYLEIAEGETEIEFTLSSGESNYYSTYTTKFYTSGKIILDIAGRNEVYDFVIINLEE